MKKINRHFVNAALWAEILLSYLLPFQVTEASEYKVGFPLHYITVYYAEPSFSPLTSMALNPIALFANGIILYFAISLIHTLGVRGRNTYQKIKQNNKGT